MVNVKLSIKPIGKFNRYFVFLRHEIIMALFCFSFFFIGFYGLVIKAVNNMLLDSFIGLCIMLFSLIWSWFAVFRHALSRATRLNSGVSYVIDFEQKSINEFVGGVSAREFYFNKKIIKISKRNKDGSGTIEIGGGVFDLLENKTHDIFQSLDLDEKPITFVLHEVENVENVAQMLRSGPVHTVRTI